jgi:hypothetical protein
MASGLAIHVWTIRELSRTPEAECDISKLANPVTFLLWSDSSDIEIETERP